MQKYRTSKEPGMRHRAAIGLFSSDAFTFVVSEETGGGMTYNGTFHDLTLEEFEAELRSFLVPEENKREVGKSWVYLGG